MKVVSDFFTTLRGRKRCHVCRGVLLMLAKVTLPAAALFLAWPDEWTEAAAVFSILSVAKKIKQRTSKREHIHKFLLPSLGRPLFGFAAEFLFTSSGARMLVGVVPVCGLRGIHCGFAMIWAVTYTGIQCRETILLCDFYSLRLSCEKERKEGRKPQGAGLKDDSAK